MAGKLAEGLKAHGAEKVYVAESDEADGLPLPRGGRAGGAGGEHEPGRGADRCSRADGKEIAGRLAVRTGSAWLNDVVAVDRPKTVGPG